MNLGIHLIGMDFGTNLYNWFLPNAKSVLLLALVVIGLWLVVKREITKLTGFLIIAAIAVVLVYNADGVQGVLLDLANKVLGAGGK